MQVILNLKTIYINDKKNMTERRIKRISKKVYKIGLKEDVIVALAKHLNCNLDLIKAIEETGTAVLNRKMVI